MKNVELSPVTVSTEQAAIYVMAELNFVTVSYSLGRIMFYSIPDILYMNNRQTKFDSIMNTEIERSNKKMQGGITQPILSFTKRSRGRERLFVLQRPPRSSLHRLCSVQGELGAAMPIDSKKTTVLEKVSDLIPTTDFCQIIRSNINQECPVKTWQLLHKIKRNEKIY